MSTVLYELTGPWNGRLAIAARPRGGDWLTEDMQAMRSAGVDVLVSTLTAAERSELDLSHEAAAARSHGLEYVSFPIDDRGVPSSVPATLELVQRINADLEEGRAVAIHCRTGIGRSSLMAAAVLTLSGVAPAAAFQSIATARGLSVPDTPEQQRWVEAFATTISERQRAAS